MIDKDYEILIPDKTREWLLKCVPCYISRDFAGYLFILDDKKKIGGAVSLSGDFIVYSIDDKHLELSDNQVKKIYKKLYKLGFIYQGIQPFPELKLLPNDPKNTFIIHDYLFDNIREEKIQWR